MKTRPRWMVARDVKEEESLWFRGGANLGFDFDNDDDDLYIMVKCVCVCVSVTKK